MSWMSNPTEYLASVHHSNLLQSNHQSIVARIDYSPHSRSLCPSCHSIILHGELRIGSRIDWTHFECLDINVLNRLIEQDPILRIAPYKLSGLDSLAPEDQKRALQYICALRAKHRDMLHSSINQTISPSFNQQPNRMNKRRRSTTDYDCSDDDNENFEQTGWELPSKRQRRPSIDPWMMQ